MRRSRRRFWKSENDADKLSAYTTLYECLVTLSKLLAPFVPFLAEELYQNLVCSAFPEAPDSVHLTDFPVPNKTKIDKQLGDDIRLAMEVSSAGRAARSKAGIKVRQPLAHAVVRVSGSSDIKSLERLKSQILEELNVKDIILKGLKEVEELDGHGYAVSGIEQRREEHDFYKKGSSPLFGVHPVAVPTEISPELQAEGMAREIVHRLQNMRRSAGFDIADHIITFYQGEDYIRGVMSNAATADYIKQETLSRQLIDGVPEQDVFTESHKLGGYDILLGVKRLG